MAVSTLRYPSANLPAIGKSKLDIDTRDSRFLIASFGVGLAWKSEANKQRHIPLTAADQTVEQTALSFSDPPATADHLLPP